MSFSSVSGAICEEVSYNLTDREIEVLKLLKIGKSTSQIARELFVSVHTAKAHICNIFYKMDVHDRVAAVIKAIKADIIDL